MLERLGEKAAEDIADQLRGAGAQVQMLPMDKSANRSVGVRLASLRPSKIQVIRTVREIMGLGLREFKE